jgi:hypothetical protein
VKIRSLNTAPVITVTIAGQERKLIIDTGSSISMIQPGVCSGRLKPTDVTPLGVTGDELQIKGELWVKLQIGNQLYHHQFCVCTMATEAHGILGLDFLSKYRGKLDLEAQELWLLNRKGPTYESSEAKPSETSRTTHPEVLTVFTSTERGAKRQEIQIKCTQNSSASDKQSSHPKPETRLQEAEPWRVKKTKTVSIAPRVSKQIPSKERIRAKLTPDDDATDYTRKLNNVRSSLRAACKAVRENMRKSHETNKRYYDKKAETRTFDVGEIIYFAPLLRLVGVPTLDSRGLDRGELPPENQI